MAELATVKTVEHTDASDLPEINWLWRRVFVFALTAGLAGHVYLTSGRLTDVRALHDIVRNDQWLIGLLAMLYIAGASSEAITRLVGAVRTTRKETFAEGPPPAKVTEGAVDAARAGVPEDPTMFAGPR